MNENICKIEAKGFQDLCNYIRELEEKKKFLETENQELKHENNILKNELATFKEDYIAELQAEQYENELVSAMASYGDDF